MRIATTLLFFGLAWTGWATAASAPTLPGTTPLEPATGDERSREMVAAIDRFSEGLIASAAQERTERWKHALADENGRATFKTEMRQKLRACLGMVDEAHRVAHPRLEIVSPADTPGKPLAEGEGWTAHWVRWPVFDGVTGEGVLLRPKGRVLARVICVPDAVTSPLEALWQAGPESPLSLARRMAASGCEVIAPVILNRDTKDSVNERFGIKTNVPRREWIHRQAYLLGRTLTGYETEKLLALADALTSDASDHPVLGVIGQGEGGWLALHAAALDERFNSIWLAGCFTSRDHLWEEPLDRNTFGYLNDFDAAEEGALIAPRRMLISLLTPPSNSATVAAPPAKGVRNIAAPGSATYPDLWRAQQQTHRLVELLPTTYEQRGTGLLLPSTPALDGAKSFLLPLGLVDLSGKEETGAIQDPLADVHQSEQTRELQNFTQARIAECENERETGFWKAAPLTSPEDAEKFANNERQKFWRELIGKLPDPSAAMQPRSRLISENDSFAEYDVVLDVWPGVTAWGYLLLPKNIAPGERRPVVVCQHGLEGLPEDVVTEDPKAPGWKFYKGFAAQLARQGYITFAPHNFYRGKDAFRVVQRKLNLTGKTLYSVIIGQHQRILQYLQSRPDVDAGRIAFYGLSYGGKSAMRIPAALPGYCLSICSGDFNEWVRKCVSLDMPSCYVYTPEYEIWEWNLARTYNYAEMAALIAPRPFMVERGHNDGVGLDEWVSYEYAKVRRYYDKAGIGDNTRIEYFNGPHTIHGVGTFQFLHDKLK